MEWLSIKEAEEGGSERTKDPLVTTEPALFTSDISEHCSSKGGEGGVASLDSGPRLKSDCSRLQRNHSSHLISSADFNFVARWRSQFLC